MRILFVGSNPSHLGPDSPAIRNLKQWVGILGVEKYFFVNVSSHVTQENRPLKKSEYDLVHLSSIIPTMDRVVALGNTAAEALKILHVEHFKLPHPSPKNRILNDRSALISRLGECKAYLEKSC